jgi:hypothetical protein
MTAINRNMTKIYMVAAGVNPSALQATDVIAGEIKSYNKSGGEKDVESDPVFGGFIDKEKPITQVEIELEVIPSIQQADRWDAITYAQDVANTSGSRKVYTMASTTSTQPVDRMIVIEATSGTLRKSWAFNNCNVTVFDLEHNADDNQTGNITFKFSPTTSRGVSNFMTQATAATSLPAWTALDNNA